jgi:hypothetical protein
MKAVLFAVFAVLPLAACHGGEAPKPPEGSMPVTIVAAKDATYDFRCRYRAVKLKGQGPANASNLSGKGPRDDAFIPTDNARCTLKQTGGTGPVDVTIQAKTGPVRASVAGVGATANLDVL